MNRTIKFRGKRIDTGEWVIGGAYKHDPPLVCFGKSDEQSRWYIIKTGFADWQMPRPMDAYEVDPSTVGQFTGLHDKDGKEIYDGDVVKCQQGCPHIVAFVEDNGGTYFGGMPGFNLMGLGRNGGIGYAWSQEEELIGNIHDNPELIEIK